MSVTDRRTVQTVVVLLGTIALALICWAGWLTHETLHAPAAKEASGLLAPVWALAGTAVGGLTTLLVSTRTTPNAAEVTTALQGLTPSPMPVTIDQQNETTPVPVDTSPPDEPQPPEEPAPPATAARAEKRNR